MGNAFSDTSACLRPEGHPNHTLCRPLGHHRRHRRPRPDAFGAGVHLGDAVGRAAWPRSPHRCRGVDRRSARHPLLFAGRRGRRRGLAHRPPRPCRSPRPAASSRPGRAPRGPPYPDARPGSAPLCAGGDREPRGQPGRGDHARARAPDPPQPGTGPSDQHALYQARGADRTSPNRVKGEPNSRGGSRYMWSLSLGARPVRDQGSDPQVRLDRRQGVTIWETAAEVAATKVLPFSDPRSANSPRSRW